MNIIKLNAIESTNTFLKQLILNQYVDNFTIVTTENQTKGKGQVGAVWCSEAGKNLTFSILIKDSFVNSNDLFVLNTIVSVSLIHALKKFKICNLAIKWPNDILADQKKIAGILIENIFKGSNEIVSVVGIGLNVNQLLFENLPQASSLAILNGQNYDRELLLQEIVSQLKVNVTKFINLKKNDFWDDYHNLLFKKDIPTVFVGADNQNFMGIIKGVSKIGRLIVLLEDDSIKEFDIKELKMLY
jgi:BirA family biotin operon repressor/biotin-[acetyl-CoA-carboxylase] ligase